MAAQVGTQLLGRLPLFPDVVKHGDAGTPAVLAGAAFATLAERVWEFVTAPTEAVTA